MIPRIDPRVKYVGASHLRKLNSNQLRQLEGVMVVRDNSEPLAVIVPYETYLKLQVAAGVLHDGPIVSYEDQASLKERLSTSEFGPPTSGPVFLDTTGPELSSGKGKATVETRGIRPKGDSKR